MKPCLEDALQYMCNIYVCMCLDSAGNHCGGKQQNSVVVSCAVCFAKRHTDSLAICRGEECYNIIQYTIYNASTSISTNAQNPSNPCDRKSRISYWKKGKDYKPKFMGLPTSLLRSRHHWWIGLRRWLLAPISSSPYHQLDWSTQAHISVSSFLKSARWSASTIILQVWILKSSQCLIYLLAICITGKPLMWTAVNCVLN